MLELRKAVDKDASQLHALDEEIFQTSSYCNYASLVADNNSLIFAAMNGDELVGYIYFSKAVDEAELYHIGVKENYREEHIATDLLEKGINQLKSEGVKTIFLEVRHKNKVAISLYVKAGFLKYKVRKDYYGRGADAFCYMMEVK